MLQTIAFLPTNEIERHILKYIFKFCTKCWYLRQFIKITSCRIKLVARQLENQQVSFRGQFCIKCGVWSRVRGNIGPINVEIYIGICAYLICILMITSQNQIYVLYFYHYCTVTMVTANHFQLSCHFHKEPFWAPRVKLSASWREYVFYCRLHVKSQHFNIYLDTFEQIVPFEGKI